ncbi:hypothetical protein BH10BDE1_BH10BDE1_23410 [soil metagenome]
MGGNGICERLILVRGALRPRGKSKLRFNHYIPLILRCYASRCSALIPQSGGAGVDGGGAGFFV